MKTVRTYMIYPDQIDPAHILTMADLELSVSLAETLVKFDDRRELISDLAERWSVIGENKMQFTLKSDLKWSNGEKVTAQQYKEALLRAKKVHGSDLKALFDVVERIEASDDRNLIFTTTMPIEKSGLLIKLTEPMYGLIALNGDKVDLTKSVGAFYVEKNTPILLTLGLNKNWHLLQPNMPERIEIKQPPKDRDQLSGFTEDNWANLVSGSSILTTASLENFDKNGFYLWKRTEDKLYALYPSKNFAKKGGANLLKSLSSTLKGSHLLDGYHGFTDANQFFPRGYALWSATPPKVDTKPFKYTNEIRIILPESSIAKIIKEKLLKAFKIAGTEANFEIVKLNDINARMKAQDYEILATNIAVADANFEGAVSFFIERDPPFIPSAEKPNDFAEQVKEARGLSSIQKKADRMRTILLKAQEAGFVLPLFHSSSVAVAKSPVDISGVPNSDETVHFAKVRVK